ncbi:MAG: TIGR02281 family clan AA aspartic protease [Deltaproteobacteria bacterium]
MRKAFCAASFAVFVLFPFVSQADILLLKNGNSIRGIIKEESPESVTLEIDIGTVKFSRREIEKVERSTSPSEAALLRDQWERDRKQEADQRRVQIKIEQNKRREQEEFGPKSEKVAVDDQTGHIIVNALLNGKVSCKLIVDTGASMVVLSRKIGDKLEEAGVKPRDGKIKQVDLTLGDGRKVKADFVVLDNVMVQSSSAESIEAAILPDEGTTPGYDGVLGMSFLSRFEFSFNQKEGRLTLEKLK